VVGDNFDLFDASLFSTQNFNSSTDFILPALGSGLAWNVDSFTTSGVLFVVPEAESLQLALAAAAVLMGGWRRAHRTTRLLLSSRNE
jgi:hypothetical protein